jgi:hypothetical protein
MDTIIAASCGAYAGAGIGIYTPVNQPAGVCGLDCSIGRKMAGKFGELS